MEGICLFWKRLGFRVLNPTYGTMVRLETAPGLDWRNWLRINGMAEFLAVFVVNHLFITRCFRYREVDGHHARP